MEYVYIVIYILISVVAAFAVIFALVGAQSISRLSATAVPRAILYIIGFGVIFSSISSGRNLALVGQSIGELYVVDSSPIFGQLLKFANIVASLLAFGVCIERILNGDKALRLVPSRATWLMVLIFLVISTNILPSAFGSHPRFSPGLIYSLPVFCMLALDGRWVRDDLLSVIRNICFAALAVGPLVALFAPNLVIERGFHGALSFMPFRYWGVAPHANALGGMAVLSLLVLYLAPFKGRSYSVSMGVLALGTLFAAQSKTAFLGAIISVFVIYCYRVVSTFDVMVSLRRMSVVRILGILFVAFACLCFLIIAALSPQILDSASRSSSEGASLLTLTGRATIWYIGLAEWRANPFFGYGPDFLDVEHRYRIGMLHAFHAHNQFIQTLAQSGMVGIIGLLMFLFLAAKHAIMSAAATRGTSIGLLTFLLTRCVTEVPIRSGAMLSVEFLTILTLLIIIIPHSRAGANCLNIKIGATPKAELSFSP